MDVFKQALKLKLVLKTYVLSDTITIDFVVIII